MEFFTVQTNQIIIKTFISFDLALTYVKEFYSQDENIQIYHEEYLDDNNYCDSHGYKTLVWPK